MQGAPPGLHRPSAVVLHVRRAALLGQDVKSRCARKRAGISAWRREGRGGAGGGGGGSAERRVLELLGVWRGGGVWIATGRLRRECLQPPPPWRRPECLGASAGSGIGGASDSLTDLGQKCKTPIHRHGGGGGGASGVESRVEPQPTVSLWLVMG